jgi:outer membrane lipoprotein-sorting protein
MATASTVALLGGAAIVATSAQAAPSLPPRTAEQLLVDVQSPTDQTLSGTVQTSADLGLPTLPTGSGTSSSDPTALLSGDNTVRVWLDGNDRSRVSVIGSNEETSIIHNGSDVWTYSSADRTAKHMTVDRTAAEHRPTPLPQGAPTTPQEAAKQVLTAMEPSTTVTTSGTARVAGRDAYELVLTPAATEDTLVKSVTFAIDAETHLVLDVTVLGKGSDKPALQVGFSKIDYGTPDAHLFTFTAPAGTTVKEVAPPTHGTEPTPTDAKKADQAKPTVVGDGWDSVVVTKTGPVPTSAPTTDDPQAQQAKSLLESLPRVSGDWGSGRLLSGTVFSAVLTDDGRVAVGAVPADRLYAALR